MSYAYTDNATLHAANFLNDLEAVLDHAITIGGGCRIVLVPGHTYTAPATEYVINSINNVAILGNGATINCPDGQEAAFRLQACDNWLIRNTVIAAGADTAACLRAFIFEAGCGRIYFSRSEFYGFGAAALRGRGGGGVTDADNYLMAVDTCLFHDLGSQLWGGSGVGIGVDCSRFRYAQITNSEFHTIGTLATSHGIYPSRGTEDAGAAGAQWLVSNCVFRDIAGFGVKLSGNAGGTVQSAEVSGCHFYDSPGVVFDTVQQAIVADSAMYVEGAGAAAPYVFTRVDGGGVNELNLTGNNAVYGGTLDVLSSFLRIDSNLVGGVVANNFGRNIGLFIKNDNEMTEVLVTNNVALDCHVFFESFAADNLEGVSIVANRFSSLSATAGIRIQNGTNITILDNEQVASQSGGTVGPMIQLDISSSTLDRIYVRGNKGRNATVYRNITGLTNSLVGEAWYWNQSGAPVMWRDAFTDGDTTPSVIKGTHFRTGNTGATTITGFDDALRGKEWFVEINDANTTLDFTSSNLKGNNGVDYACASGDMLKCFFDGTVTHVWISEA